MGFNTSFQYVAKRILVPTSILLFVHFLHGILLQATAQFWFIVFDGLVYAIFGGIMAGGVPLDEMTLDEIRGTGALASGLTAILFWIINLFLYSLHIALPGPGWPLYLAIVNAFIEIILAFGLGLLGAYVLTSGSSHDEWY